MDKLKVNHVIPVEVAGNVSETFSALGTISGGRRINLIELKGVRLNEVELRVNNLVSDVNGAGQYVIKPFFIGSLAGDTSVTAIGTSITSATAGAVVTNSSAVVGGGRRFDKVIAGLEISGGTTGGGITLDANIFANGSIRGAELVLPAAGHDSAIKPGSSLAFNSTTSDLDITLEADATILANIS